MCHYSIAFKESFKLFLLVIFIMYIVHRSNSYDTFNTTCVQEIVFESKICIQTFTVRMSAYFFTLGKNFMDVRIENQTSKSDENLGTNGGDSTLFQRKKPPNSCKARTVANVLRVIKHIGTIKCNEKIKGSQNHEISY